MPTIQIEKQEIETLMGVQYSIQEFSDILFNFGLEIDEVIFQEDTTTYKVEIPANRYDLLCPEGLSNTLQSYLFNKQYEDYKLIDNDKYTFLREETNHRACLASAVIKGFKFDKKSYKRFIDYQEKLSETLGRHRSIVSIGTHDYSKIKFPVVFKSMKKEDVKFVPLGCTEIVTDLYKHFKNNKKMLRNLAFLEKDKYTVLCDATGTILSVPPIINSEYTKITIDTTDIFVEISGTNQHKVDVCLRMLLSAFRTDEMFKVTITGIPNKNERRFKRITTEEVKKELNINVTEDVLKNLLRRMMYKVDSWPDIEVPFVRQDVIHKCDIMEDIAVAYGYKNFEKTLPEINIIGGENMLNKYSDKIRSEMATLGFVEVCTLVLISRVDDPKGEVLVGNYKSLECEVVRSSLYPGLLKSVACNLHCKIPLKIFEVGDVVYLDKDNDVGASNRRMLSCLYVGNTSHLEDIQGPLSMILEKCNVKDYEYVRTDDETKYLKNQSAILKVKGEVCGSIGVCNGSVLSKYKIPYSGSMFELDIENIFHLN